MSNIFQFYALKEDLSAPEIAALYSIGAGGMLEIKRRASCREPMLEIELNFARDDEEWLETKAGLIELLHEIEAGTVPLRIQEDDRHYSVAEAFERIKLYRQYWIDNDIMFQLEDGEIESEDEYEMPGENEL